MKLLANLALGVFATVAMPPPHLAAAARFGGVRGRAVDANQRRLVGCR